jgi:hypothetical protein
MTAVRTWWIAMLLAAGLQAAVIRGTVVENLTGKPLYRASIVLTPVSGTPGGAQGSRTNQFGGFEFGGLAGGSYLMKISRPGFMTVEYGQKRWNSAGVPIVIDEANATFLNIRLPRYSAISGTVVDENDIGLPDHEVVAYRNTRPPQIAARATTDDRGAYRIYGLEPGTYVVRSVGKQYPEGGYLPTYSKETERLEQARTVDLFAEQQVNNVDLRPFPGKLFTLSTFIVPPLPEGAQVTLTLASDTGRKTVNVSAFQFTSLAPGPYELYAEADGLCAYQRLSLTHDTKIPLQTFPCGGSVQVAGAPPDAQWQLLTRRRDLAGDGEITALPVSRNRAAISSGRWLLMLVPPSGYYVSGFRGSRAREQNIRPDAWNEIEGSGYTYAQFTLSSGPGALRGVVKSSGEPIAGAPVYLEAYDPVERKRLKELQTTRTDMRGQYRFDSLAPGTYRILGTFEYLNPDAEAMDAANAASMTIDAKSEQSRDLELYIIP